jgi:alkylation response protein AidB-like acyl-CoA dehydrogenase
MRSTDEITRPKEYLSPLDETLRHIIREWAEKEVIPNRRRFDEDWKDHHLIEPAFKKLMGEMGMQRAPFPEDLGGLGMGHSEHLGSNSFLVLEEMARADSGIAVSYGVTFWPLFMICNEPHVNRRLCEEFAPMFCDTTEARFAANAMTEPQGGADIENLELLKGSTITTTAIQDGDEWVINGHKLWPTNTGGVAHLFGVVATTKSGSNHPRDFAFILVPADTPGVKQGDPYEKGGMAADKNGDIWFDNVRVPSWYRACGPGDDFKYFKEVISIGSLGSIAMISGSMLNVYEALQGFTSNKRFHGKLLKEYDAIAGVLADIVRDIEIIRITGYQYARMIDRPDLYGQRWSDEIVTKGRVYKYFACDRAVEDLGKAMNLMEAYGADREWDVEKHWRDLKIIQLWMGGKQLCQMETARWFFECKTL